MTRILLLALLLTACDRMPPEGAARTESATFASVETFPGASAMAPGEVTGLLTLPKGAGPFPAIVMLHGCAGLYETHAEWAALAASWGWASLRVDSFGPRGIEEICTDILKPVPRAADVNGAIAYLQARPEIDASHLVVMGWSHGAGVALQVAAEPGSLREDLKAAVLGTVALYPYCSRSSQPFRTPLLVLVGDADDWTPAALCESMVEHLPATSAPVELAVYPGATHSFDCKLCDGDYWGHRLVFDPVAYEDAAARVQSFLAETLSSP